MSVLLLAGCVETTPPPPAAVLPPAAIGAPVAEAAPMMEAPPGPGETPDYQAMYAANPNEPFPVPAINLSKVDPQFLRREVDYQTDQPVGTIVIDPHAHYLYLVEPNGRAIRYGVGVGKAGFAWSGIATIKTKQHWPDWYPPKEMYERQPELKSHMSQLQSGLGVPGGPRNPLGARAMYLWQNNKDTLYRIHGTLEPWTIGKSVSSGCIRMINQDVMDLYERVPENTEVVVVPSSGVIPLANGQLVDKKQGNKGPMLKGKGPVTQTTATGKVPVPNTMGQ
ncbi:L,D-transpeptidase [Faunimonas pinastri]